MVLIQRQYSFYVDISIEYVEIARNHAEGFLNGLSPSLAVNIQFPRTSPKTPFTGKAISQDP